MITQDALIKKFQQALDERWGYIWGERGDVWTETKQAASTRDMTIKYGAKWLGKRVADCSGLFSWAFKELGGYMYQGSNTMWDKYMDRKGKIKADVYLKPASAVFKSRGDDRYHVGLYIGSGKVIEAKGTTSGVVISDIKDWDEWGEPKGVEFNQPGPTDPIPDKTFAIVNVPSDQNVFFRISPNKESPWWARLNGGQMVEIVSIKNGWARALALGYDGYIDDKFVKLIPSGGQLPVPVPTPIEPPGIDTVTITLPHSAAQALFDALGIALRG